MFYGVDSRENCGISDKHKTNRQGRGVLNSTEKIGAENITPRIEVESVPIARVGNPTTWHRKILISNTQPFHILNKQVKLHGTK